MSPESYPRQVDSNPNVRPIFKPIAAEREHRKLTILAGLMPRVIREAAESCWDMVYDISHDHLHDDPADGLDPTNPFRTEV